MAVKEVKVVLFDADGVAILAPQLFSSVHAQNSRANINHLENGFFKGEFLDALVGKADLKELVLKHADIWDWHGDPEELLDRWFETENHPNQELLKVIKLARQKGIICCMATNQERYRTAYLRTTTFPGIFDEIFSSAEIGLLKNDPKYFKVVLDKLATDVPGLEPEEVVYFDDSQDNIDVASSVGIRAYLYSGVPQVRDLLVA